MLDPDAVKVKSSNPGLNESWPGYGTWSWVRAHVVCILNQTVFSKGILRGGKAHLCHRVILFSSPTWAEPGDADVVPQLSHLLAPALQQAGHCKLARRVEPAQSFSTDKQ